MFQPPRLEPRTSVAVGSFWPTPAASDWKDWNYTRGHGNHSPRLSRFLFLKFGMYPSVPLYEWLMSYPGQWTRLEHWATQWYRKPLAKRSCVSQE